MDSAGLLLVRGEGHPQFLIAHPGGPYWASRDHGAWSLIKGEFDPRSEPAIQAALREFHEETGHPAPNPETLVSLGTVTQKGGKTVHGFAARGDFDPASLDSNTFELEWPPRSGNRRTFPEIDRVAWFGLAEARTRINPAQVEFLDRALAAMGSG